MEGDFAGLFDPQNKGSKNSRKISEHFFCKKFVAPKKYFVPKFALRKCHLNDMAPFRWPLLRSADPSPALGSRVAAYLVMVDVTCSLGHSPSTAGTFRQKLRKRSGKTPETLSERFLEFPSRVRLGSHKPYSSRLLRLPEHFQNSLPLSTAGDASSFQKWFRTGPLRACHGIPSSTRGISYTENAQTDFKKGLQRNTHTHTHQKKRGKKTQIKTRNSLLRGPN